MTRRFNFGAGPATMPEVVLEEVQQELLDWNGLGLSVMEISHRSPEFIEIAKQAESDFRDLLDITDSYAVLFLHGGATLQNAMIPLNLSLEGGTADYGNTGHWAKRSINEAKKYKAIVPFKRPKSLSSDTAKHIHVWRHFINHLKKNKINLRVEKNYFPIKGNMTMVSFGKLNLLFFMLFQGKM